jgi:transcriptional regulator with AAA-type ATPase domain/tetratricopeptide (TPR) repeat protein
MKPLADLLGESSGIEAIRDRVIRLLERQQDARRLPPVLIEGETGTGKGLLARLLHRAGPRPDGPFVDVNCAAIPATLLESEMFGFEKGAFTDARRAKPGLFQAAHRGTIFLDEVGLLPEALQAKFLKVLEERSVRRLGGTRDEPVDIWIVTATNEDLRLAMRKRRFREDLYHRLAVLTLSLPPLRERGGDVLLLAQHYLGRACADYAVSPKTLTHEAREAMLAYSWPGNIRELANLMERVALMSSDPEVTVDALGLPASPPATAPSAPIGPTRSLDDAVRDRVLAALRQTSWNISRTAVLLGISRNTVRARIEKYDLRQGDDPAPTAIEHAEPPQTTADAEAAGAASALPTAPAPTALRWERRRVALLRALLVPAPADLEVPLETNRALEALIEKVESFGGSLEGVSPTGVIAAFGLEATGDSVDRAAHGAAAILKATERAQPEGGARVEVKLGIHVAQVLVGLTAGDAKIALEARQRLWPLLDDLVQPADPNEIVLSDAAAPFLRRRFEVLAGVTPRTYRLGARDRVGLDAGGRLTRFVGRKPELDALRSYLEAARRGQGQIVGIGGDAGIGKSRLILEFRQGLPVEPGTYLESHCHSHGASVPYLPVLELLRMMCGITDVDEPDAIAKKIRAGLTAVGLDPVHAEPPLLQGLGVKEGVERVAQLSPEAVKARIFETTRQLILRRSRATPLVIVLEDLHWIDKTSEEFFGSLAAQIAPARILLVSTYRWGYRPPWGDKSYATQIALQPLAPDDCLSLVQSLLATREAPDPLARLILDRAEGNPFFIEELTRVVAAHEDALPDLGVPETVQDVLLARIERLPEAPRRLLQAASVLGRQAPLLLLRALWAEPEELDALLLELANLEFLYEMSGVEETTYMFRHSLTQEVAYETLAPSRRQTLHEVVGHALEALYTDRLEEACDRLAYHYGRTKDDGKAVRYLTMAANRSARGYAHAEAIQTLRTARERIERAASAPERERWILDLLLREAHSLHVLGRFAETLDLLVHHQARVDELNDASCAGPFYFWLGRTYSVLGDRAHTTPAVRRAVDYARAADDRATLGKANFLLAYEDYWGGRPAQGVVHGNEAARLLEGTDERWWLGMAHWLVAMNSVPVGEFESGLDAAERANAIGETIGDLRLQNYAAWSRGWLETARGEHGRAIEACELALRRSQDPVNTAQAVGYLAMAHLESGGAERAIALLERAVGELRSFHPAFRMTLARFLASLSEARTRAGGGEAAVTFATEALALGREVGFAYAIGVGLRALGHALAAAGDHAGAASRFDEALATFDAMGARFEAARTRLALADAHRAAGDRAGALSHARAAAAALQGLGAQRWEALARTLVGSIETR